MTEVPFHDAEEETLDPQSLAILQRRKLRARWAEVLRDNAFYRHKLAGVTFDPLSDPLVRLPMTTRAELQQDQRNHPPYGTNLTFELSRYRRVHQTSASQGAPLRWLDTEESWIWWKRCWAIIYRAAGLTQDDRFLFPFSFGPFIGFWAAFESAAALGNVCLPCGGMTTSARLRYLMDHRATVVCCTPTYALRMAEAARDEALDLASTPVRALIVAGEPGGSVPATRQRIERAWGARAFDHAGMTEVGPWGFECLEAPGGMHVMESEFIAEVVDPASGEPVADGQAGELVLTNLGRAGSPLLRYRTGDEVRLTHQRCPCGRWFARVEDGILGRLDDMVIIRGNNIFPSAVEDVLCGFADVAEFGIEVDERGPMPELCILVEPRPEADRAGLGHRVESAIRDRLHFRPRVVLVEPGTLPRFEMKARRLLRRVGPASVRKAPQE